MSGSRWRWLRDWFPHRSFCHANWCGYIVILHAPKHVSRMTGHGEIGLEWQRRPSSLVEYQMVHLMEIS